MQMEPEKCVGAVPEWENAAEFEQFISIYLQMKLYCY